MDHAFCILFMQINQIGAFEVLQVFCFVLKSNVALEILLNYFLR